MQNGRIVSPPLRLFALNVDWNDGDHTVYTAGSMGGEQLLVALGSLEKIFSTEVKGNAAYQTGDVPFFFLLYNLVINDHCRSLLIKNLAFFTEHFKMTRYQTLIQTFAAATQKTFQSIYRRNLIKNMKIRRIPTDAFRSINVMSPAYSREGRFLS